MMLVQVEVPWVKLNRCNMTVWAFLSSGPDRSVWRRFFRGGFRTVSNETMKTISHDYKWVSQVRARKINDTCSNRSAKA